MKKLPIKIIEAKNGLMLIEIEEGQYSGCKLLLDTGSPYSILFPHKNWDVKKPVVFEYADPTPVVTISALGSQSQPAEVIYSDIVFAGEELKIPFCIMKNDGFLQDAEQRLGHKIIGLIGMNLIKFKKWQIDAANNCITIEEGDIVEDLETDIKLREDLEIKHPIITITRGTFEGCNFLVDTGATDSFMYDTIYNKHREHFTDIDEANNKALLADGSMIHIHRAKANIFLGNCYLRTPFTIIGDRNKPNSKGMQINGVIGIDIIRELNWVIDPKNHKIKINNQLSE